MRNQNASVLVGLLWCLALVSVIVIGVLHSGQMDLQVVKNQGDRIQAHYLALAGVEKAKALLYQDAITRKRASQNHSGELYNSPTPFRDIRLGRGSFRVFHQGDPEKGEKIQFGIADEESRLNVNEATAEDLSKLRGMIPEIAAAITDWRDTDNSVTPSGAEAEYYTSLQPPYLPRNGPFETVRELLMVRGVTHSLLLGEDENDNGLMDPEENDGTESYPPDNHDGVLDSGWSASLTVKSQVSNLDAAGQDRVNVQSADEGSLAAVPGLTADIAKAIVASRNQKKIETLADLLEVTSAPPASGPQGAQGVQGASAPGLTQPPPGIASGQAGNKVIDEKLLIEIADQLTCVDTSDQSGLVNINTASSTVLKCLPGMDSEKAQAIIMYRQSSGYLPNIAHLLRVPGMNQPLFKALAPRVTARSETFRILSEGSVRSSGVRQRIEVVVKLTSTDVETLSYREDL